MLIVIDIGNTTVSVGVFKGEKLRLVRQVESRLAPELLAHHLRRIFAMFRPDKIQDVVICSVVPRVALIVERVARKTFHKRPLLIGRDVMIPMRNRYANPRQVGQDRLVCAFAAAVLRGTPAIVIDLGTAITVDIVSSKKEYLGGIIIPGLRLSAESLFQKTALLPMVEIKGPRNLIGKDTRGSILSGLFYGYGQMLQGLVGLIKREVGGRPQVIITGGYAALMEKFINPVVDVVEPHLVFKGMRLAWKQAQSKASF